MKHLHEMTEDELTAEAEKYQDDADEMGEHDPARLYALQCRRFVLGEQSRRLVTTESLADVKAQRGEALEQIEELTFELAMAKSREVSRDVKALRQQKEIDSYRHSPSECEKCGRKLCRTCHSESHA